VQLNAFATISELIIIILELRCAALTLYGESYQKLSMKKSFRESNMNPKHAEPLV